MFGPISDVDLLDLMVALFDDETRRHELDSGHSFHEAAAAAGLISRTDQNGFALSVGEAFQQGLLRFRSTAGGVTLRSPHEGLWTDHDLQSRFYYSPTAAGREFVLTNRRLQRLDQSAGSLSSPSLSEARSLLTDGARADAVIEAVEGVLAASLRALAERHAVSLARADGRPLALAALNDQLAKAGAYSRAQHAEIQSWLHHRNSFAHREEVRPSDAQVHRLIDGVELFVASTEP